MFRNAVEKVMVETLVVCQLLEQFYNTHVRRQVLLDDIIHADILELVHDKVIGLVFFQ